MTFLPIVSRELRVASRRRATFWARTLAATMMIILATWFFLMMREQPAAEIAKVLFGILTGCAVLYCLLSGIRMTADCLSHEKRDGTLGLLFLTDLKGYDVVLGKLAATSLSAFYAVLAMVPMLAVPLLMGGLTAGEFGRMALVAINALFFSLAAGIWVSAISRGARSAMAVTALVLIVITAAPPLWGSWELFFGRSRTVQTELFLPSVGYSYFRAWDAPYKLAKNDFWISMGIVHGMGWFFLVLAAVIVPRSWQDRPSGAAKLKWRERWLSWSYGDFAERLTFRRRLLDQGAFFWLSSRARLKPALVWGVLGLIACGWVWGLVKFGRDWLNSGVYIATAMILNITMKGWVASEAGRQVAEDRQHGTLELLLSTALSVRDILHGQFLALLRQFLGPLIVVIGTFLTFMLAIERESWDDSGLWGFFWVSVIVMLVADLVAIFWVGSWAALTAKNPQRASSSTIAVILVLPWIIIAGVALFLSLSTIGSPSDEPGTKFFIGLWLLVGLGVDLFFGLRARSKVMTQFREMAAERYVPKGGFWKRILKGTKAEPQPMPPLIVAEK